MVGIITLVLGVTHNELKFDITTAVTGLALDNDVCDTYVQRST